MAGSSWKQCGIDAVNQGEGLIGFSDFIISIDERDSVKQIIKYSVDCKIFKTHNTPPVATSDLGGMRRLAEISDLLLGNTGSPFARTLF